MRADDDRVDLRELMERYQAGELEAFDELYIHLAPTLRGWLGRQHLGFGAELEDLLQEAFAQMHRSRHTYSPGLPVEPWARAIARHVYLMDRRRRRRKQAREVHEPLDSVAADGARPDDAVERRQRVADSLERTIGTRRAPLVLHHLMGFSFREIGRILGISADTAKRRSSRGVADVRRSERSEEDEP